ncbi:MAG: leucine-rich repeat protein, partial [Oscillospiraceae bacterium]|nr:leucine-rich repeat protein [Oscillospiraceae bacterium]
MLAAHAATQTFRGRWTSDGLLTITGTGDLFYDYYNPNQTFFNGYRNQIKSVAFVGEVTGIGGNTFMGCTALTSIVIPDSVTSLGNNLFRDCTALTSIVIPEGINIINLSVFNGCTALTSVELPDSVVKISNCAFYKTALTNIKLPSKLVTIESYAFAYSALESVTLPNKLELIDEGAFENCTALKDVAFPESLTQIKAGAFWNTALEDITLPASLRLINTPGGSFPYPSKGPFTYIPTLRSVTFADGIPAIPANVLWGAENLTTVNMPNSVTEIGESAFQGCVSLSSIVLSNQLQTIRKAAFWETSLISIDLPASLTTCDAYSGFYIYSGLHNPELHLVEFIEWKGPFAYIPALRSVSFEEGATVVPNRAFSYAENLTSVTLPDSITEIGAAAFEYTPLSSITLPAKLTEIGYWAFRYTNLTSITFPNTLKLIDNKAFEGTKITDITLPASITNHSNTYPFMGIETLQSITFEQGIKTIPDAILLCTVPGVKVFVPLSVNEIGDNSTIGYVNYVIYCYPDTEAHSYARMHNIPYVLFPPHVHKYIIVSEIPATCDGYGERDLTCSECDRSKPMEVLPALGHDWSAWVLTKAATLTAEGIETHTCKRDATHTEFRYIPALQASAVTKYAVKFDAKGGTAVAAKTIASGTAV